MRIQRATPVNELLAKVIFLLAPTLLVCYFILWNANQYYSLLRQQHLLQTLYVGGGMLLAAFFYSFRFRFLPSFLVLLLIFQLVYKGIDASATGDVDAFFLANQFRVFSFTFTAGWLIGWGFIRLRFFSVFLATSFLVACVLLIAKQNMLIAADSTREMVIRWMAIFGPVVLYSVYIIFTAELIRSYKDKSQAFWWYIVRRLALFLGLSLMLLAGVFWTLQDDIKSTLAEFGGGAKEGENSMLKKKKDGTFDLEEYTRLRGNLSRNNELLFAAHIDNFFPDTELPNPLYLTAFYYSKFDTLTETFEKDSIIPANDLFEPNPSSLPLYFTKSDSSVLQYALREEHRKTVEIEVYKKSLSPTTFVAPSTAFFVQPIAIEKDFQSEFRSAYRAKSYVSDLNSAYFVYNIDEPVVRAFQEQRFELLRQVQGYSGVDQRLMNYYTFMPSGAQYARLKTLAAEIVEDKTTPADKVLAVRDYFLSKDENGNALFKYTDNPGIPDIPSASKLMYFLFENRKGYCAYYAGATLFMLRSLGIPSRITVGFLTEDRSSKNKGWYWYYADQAHAWVQVYFPGYGWLDFDTTVGNDEARESSTPDGTPPMQPPRAYLAADGVVTTVDTGRKTASIRISRMVFHDLEFPVQPPASMELDLSVAAIKKDSTNVGLDVLQPGDSATAVSFAEAFKPIKATAGEPGATVIKRFPAPAPIDEVYIKSKTTEEQASKPEVPEQAQGVNWSLILWTSLASILAILALFILLPRFILSYYSLRYKGSSKVEAKAYFAYRKASFYTHMMGIVRQGTALQHAQLADKTWGTSFSSFMIPYLKLKYANQPLNAGEEQQLLGFISPFMKQVRRSIPLKYRLIRMCFTMRALAFFGAANNQQ